MNLARGHSYLQTHVQPLPCLWVRAVDSSEEPYIPVLEIESDTLEWKLDVSINGAAGCGSTGKRRCITDTEDTIQVPNAGWLVGYEECTSGMDNWGWRMGVIGGNAVPNEGNLDTTHAVAWTRNPSQWLEHPDLRGSWRPSAAFCL